MFLMGSVAINDQMINAFVDQAVSVFQRAQRVTSGGIFLLHGLIAAVEERILPHISKFMQFLVCALRMESCDDMSTRLAAGIISDLSNNIGAAMIQYLDQIVPEFIKILQKNDYDSEAKLYTIIAFGDLTLAAGPSNFSKYLSDTKHSFFSAS